LKPTIAELEAELKAANDAKVLPLVERGESASSESAADVLGVTDAMRLPRLLRRRELARIFGVHVDTIAKWERSGLPVAHLGGHGRPSLFRESECRAWVAARRQAASQTGLDIAQERARKERWLGLLAEQAYRARARELLPAADVERVWSVEMAYVRRAVVAAYTRAGERVFRASVQKGVTGVEHELKAVAYALLTELAGERKRRKRWRNAMEVSR
jgi:phage terminase Nu1 subunit (DNA packaging protein)